MRTATTGSSFRKRGRHSVIPEPVPAIRIHEAASIPSRPSARQDLKIPKKKKAAPNFGTASILQFELKASYPTLVAGGELERSQPGVPVEVAVGRNVLIRVPERAIVNWVDGDAGVIAPASDSPIL